MSKKKEKRQSLRAYYLKRRATLEQRRQMFEQIRANVADVAPEVHQHIRAPKTVKARRELAEYKTARSMLLTSEESKAIAKKALPVDLDFVNPIYYFYEFREPSGAADSAQKALGVEDTYDVAKAPESEQKTTANAPEATAAVPAVEDGRKIAKSITEVKIAGYTANTAARSNNNVLPAPEAKETAAAAANNDFDALSVVSNFAEKRFQVRGAQKTPRQAVSNLPIAEKHFEITEALRNVDFIILRAPTGTGKSTQVPQMLMSAGYSYERPGFHGRIICTQPRRIAAVSLCARVRTEWGDDSFEFSSQQQARSANQGKEARISGENAGKPVDYTTLQTSTHRTVGYAVRGSAEAAQTSHLLFATEGVLLQMIKNNPLLSDVSVVILDEAHERSQQMDVATALVCSISRERRRIFENAAKDLSGAMSLQEFTQKFPIQPLKIIIMSATLYYAQFSHLFNLHGLASQNVDLKLDNRSERSKRNEPGRGSGNNAAPASAERAFDITLPKPVVIEVYAHAYPVAVHYEKQSVDDVLEAVVAKTVEIHRSYPPGGILIFLSGMHEVNQACQRILDELGAAPAMKQDDYQNRQSDSEEEGFQVARVAKDNAIDKFDVIKGTAESEQNNFSDDYLHVIETNSATSGAESYFVALLQQERQDATEKLAQANSKADARSYISKWVVLPLYSALPLQQQKKIYEPCDWKTTRLFIVATNIAESSLTVPGVRYVVDSCLQKVRVQTREIQQLVQQHSAVDNLIQRAGRAGRTQPGHCFRMLTPGYFGSLQNVLQPEISRLDISQILLYLIRIGVNPYRFAWPPDFDPKLLSAHLNVLADLNAVCNVDNRPRMTKFGQQIADLPLCVHAAALCCFARCALGVAVAAMLQAGCLGELDLSGFDAKNGDFVQAGVLLLTYIRLAPAQRAGFCEKYQLSRDKMGDGAQIFGQTSRMLGVEYPGATNATSSEQTLGLVIPSQEDVLLARTAVIYVFARNLGILEHEKFEKYQISQLDLREHVQQRHAEKIRELVAESPYLASAILDKRSVCRGRKFRFLIYQRVELGFAMLEDKLNVSSLLRCAQSVDLTELRDLADVSQAIDVSLPKSVHLGQNHYLMCKVDAFYGYIELGEIEAPYPGKQARATMDAADLIRRAKIALLARGDYGVKVRSAFEVQERLADAIFEAPKIRAASRLLVGVEGDFWRDGALVARIESVLI